MGSVHIANLVPKSRHTDRGSAVTQCRIFA